MKSTNASTNYQYPYPAEPRNWNPEERQFSQGLRRLFDILFARKLQNVMLADGAVNARTVAKGVIGQRHLVPGFGTALDIGSNPTALRLTTEVGAAQHTADIAESAAAIAQHTANSAGSAAAAAQSTADTAKRTANTAVNAVTALPDELFPVGTIVMMDTAPTFGAWEAFELGIPDVTAWKRVEEGDENSGNSD